MNQPKPSTHPVTLAGPILLAIGLVVWAWTGDWRWAATGLALLIAAAPIGAHLQRKADR